MRIIHTIDDTLLIPLCESGDKLYHYTSANALQGILSGEFWATESNFLNDTMEFQVATDICCEVLDAHMSNKQLCRVLQERIREEVVRTQTPGLSTDETIAYTGNYIISFCLDEDSPLMWSSYSDYIGYCIQFDFERLINSFSDKRIANSFLHGQVIYNHEFQLRLLEETIKHSYFDVPQFEYLNSWGDFDSLNDDQIEKIKQFIAVEVSAYNMFFKLPCFEGENEYRFVFKVGHDGGRYRKEDLWQQYFRVKDEVLIPYIKLKYEPKGAIEKILVGAKNKSDIAVKGLQYYCRNLKLDHIETKTSEVPLRY